MVTYWRTHTLTWGECDLFGLVYYPHILAWFNDTEHALFRALGHPIDEMVARDRTTFVMGEVQFRFTGPARYGQEILSLIRLDRIGTSTLHWRTRCVLAASGAPVCEGTATRVYARIGDDDALQAVPIPPHYRTLLQRPDAAAQPAPPGGTAVFAF